MPNLNQGIVIVNEFTVNGSRGNSPGKYIQGYMARDKATEGLTPVMMRPDRLNEKIGNIADYAVRYMARESAVEELILKGGAMSGDIAANFSDMQGLSGIAFGPDSLSMSHDDVKARSRTIQAEYEKGKPVLKTVISFDTEYLKAMGALPEDAEIKHRGDLYGKADQAKLRIAIQDGLRRIKKDFSDLDYIGVIQVDTLHLHCHLAMVDKGPGKRFTKSGEQKGMISDDMKLQIRMGIHNSLDDMKKIRQLSIQAEGEKRNTVSFIKRFAQHMIEERTIPQYLLAVLPKEDKSLWKAGIDADGGEDDIMTVRKGKSVKKIKGNMRKANEIARTLVISILNRPDSGFAEAAAAKHAYFEEARDLGRYDNYEITRYTGRGKNKKAKKVRLTPDEAVRDMDEKFKEETIKKGINAIYGILKDINDKDLAFGSPMMNAMAMPYEEMAASVRDSKLIEFGFKLRSYSSRLDYHKSAYRKLCDPIHAYEDGDRSTYDPESAKLYNLLRIERDYNHAVMCKYQHFLHFYSGSEEYERDLEELRHKRRKASARKGMKDDSELKRISDIKALELRGREKYGVDGASYLIANPGMLDSLIAYDEQEYNKALRDFGEKLDTLGLRYNPTDDSVGKGLAYDFDDVKAYDLHHLSYDFPYDFRIAWENIENFSRIAYARYDALIAAEPYIKRSGQEAALADFIDADDIIAAKELADKFKQDGTFHSRVDPEGLTRHNPSTIRLDDPAYGKLSNSGLAKMMQELIDNIDIDGPVI